MECQTRYRNGRIISGELSIQGVNRVSSAVSSPLTSTSLQFPGLSLPWKEVPTGYEAEGLASDRCSLVLDYPSEVFIGGRGPWTDFSCIISKQRVVHDLVGARQLPDGMDETVILWWQL